MLLDGFFETLNKFTYIIKKKIQKYLPKFEFLRKENL